MSASASASACTVHLSYRSSIGLPSDPVNGVSQFGPGSSWVRSGRVQVGWLSVGHAFYVTPRRATSCHVTSHEWLSTLVVSKFGPGSTGVRSIQIWTWINWCWVHLLHWVTSRHVTSGRGGGDYVGIGRTNRKWVGLPKMGQTYRKWVGPTENELAYRKWVGPTENGLGLPKIGQTYQKGSGLPKRVQTYRKGVKRTEKGLGLPKMGRTFQNWVKVRNASALSKLQKPL